jgi:hypothetical protein
VRHPRDVSDSAFAGAEGIPARHWSTVTHTSADELVKTPPYWADDAGADLMRSAAELGLEGVIAKRLHSPYQPGTRSRYWIKTPLNTTPEVVIAGWKPGDGRRAGVIGSLLLGMYDDDDAGRLTYVGNMRTGFIQRRWPNSAGSCDRWLGPPPRSSCPCRARTPAMHIGSNRGWLAKWRTGH